MIVNLVAALEAFFYLCAIPVHLAVRVEGLRVGAGLSAFERRVAGRRAARDLTREEKGGGKKRDYRRILRVLSRLQIDRAELTGRVALGDAAATALLCGGLNGLGRALGTRARRSRVDVRPDFGAGASALELSGMIRARSGKIILATLQVWTEEAFPWIITRSKT